MVHTAEQTIQNLYCDVLPYVLSDAEQNMANIVSELLQKILVGDFEVKGEGANWQFQVKDSKGIQHFISVSEYSNEKLMSVELLYEKARKHMGATEEERLRKARARTFVMTRILAKQAKAQAVTDEMLARTCNL